MYTGVFLFGSRLTISYSVVRRNFNNLVFFQVQVALSECLIWQRHATGTAPKLFHHPEYRSHPILHARHTYRFPAVTNLYTNQILLNFFEVLLRKNPRNHIVVRHTESTIASVLPDTYKISPRVLASTPQSEILISNRPVITRICVYFLR